MDKESISPTLGCSRDVAVWGLSSLFIDADSCLISLDVVVRHVHSRRGRLRRVRSFD